MKERSKELREVMVDNAVIREVDGRNINMGTQKVLVCQASGCRVASRLCGFANLSKIAPSYPINKMQVPMRAHTT